MMQEDEKRKSDEMVGRGLDRMDRRILRALQQDGGLSNQDLAAQVGLSPGPELWERLMVGSPASGAPRNRIQVTQGQGKTPII